MSVTPPLESIESRVEAHRGEWVGYCYRMLGCPFEEFRFAHGVRPMGPQTVCENA